MTDERREVVVDTNLARLWQEEADAARTLEWRADACHQANGERRERRWDSYRDMPWTTPLEETLASLRALAAGAPDQYPDHYDRDVWDAMKARDVLAQYDAAIAECQRVRSESEPLEAEYAAKRWPRFFLVQASNGHIHSSMRCSTTFPTTLWAWLPDLSGLTEADAVAAEGTRLCSICFPTAPVEWTVGLPPKVDPNRCPGSGQAGTNIRRYGRSLYGGCPVCGETVIVNRTDALRAHKTPKGQR